MTAIDIICNKNSVGCMETLGANCMQLLVSTLALASYSASALSSLTPTFSLSVSFLGQYYTQLLISNYISKDL